MKNITLLFLLFTSILSNAQTTKWANDPSHSRLGFTVLHVDINDVAGAFDHFHVNVTTTKSNFSDAVFEMTAKAASINTGVTLRDMHLKAAEFFDAEKFPLITFKSTSIKPNGNNKYKVTGNLTMHGIIKMVSADFIYRGTVMHPKSKKITAGLQVTTTLKRSDFNIGPNNPFSEIADVVVIKADGEFPKQ